MVIKNARTSTIFYCAALKIETPAKAILQNAVKLDNKMLYE